MNQILPKGWTDARMKRLVDHYETQTDDEATSEDEAAFLVEEALMQVPLELVADVRALIAKQQEKH
ncbi:MAG: hypothetical protein AAF267_05905 [Deinococcota bacterium]